MGKFYVLIKCNDGSEIEAKSIGESAKDAKARILALDQAQRHIRKSGGVHKIVVRPIYVREVMPEYRLEPSSSEEGYWVLTDLTNMIVFRFKDKQFNETQKVTPLDDRELSPLEGATAMRQAGEWLMEHHREKVI